MNRTCPVLSQLGNSPRFFSAPASCDEFGFKAVNRNVGGSNPPRGANSLVMQRVASIFKKLCPSRDEMLSARIAINLDQCRRIKINCDRCLCVLSDQSRRIAIKPKHSARNRMPISKRGRVRACPSGVMLQVYGEAKAFF